MKGVKGNNNQATAPEATIFQREGDTFPKTRAMPKNLLSIQHHVSDWG